MITELTLKMVNTDTPTSFLSLFLSAALCLWDSLKLARIENRTSGEADAAQRILEKDRKCSKLEDGLYDMQKKMAASRDEYEQQQEKS